MNVIIESWQLTTPGAAFTHVEAPAPALADGEALVEVAGCGVCHTDMSFWHHGVQTRHALPLTLGHEISGVVVDGPSELVGRSVIVPAVLPCGECDLCRAGRSNVCRNQKMPGNDFNGGFATHVVVPARFLCPVPDRLLERIPLATLSVVADAVSTPYQAVRKSGLVEGDFAIVIGVGGVGTYGALIARLLGATVLALDIDDAKLAAVAAQGVDATLNIAGVDPKTVKERVREIARALDAPPHAWKIFEFSGTKAGQELAFSLVTYASTLSIVGFTLEKVELRLSNLMAFDAQVIGTWGCRPELYPEVVALLDEGRLDVVPFVETFPLSEINEVFANTLAHRYMKRSVLVPGAHANQS
ncbi:MAG TPA: 6-hydroxycyclohex-1-ene-1-carbonyl-CoA dehydrogenase [Candidatus Kapabacteria bacterium]|nr:6-hydroxycyclohex-1-ene-1-carbonyl-CoA dehydrogenase [Candidatus Kapabacteria bacterium]